MASIGRAGRSKGGERAHAPCSIPAGLAVMLASLHALGGTLPDGFQEQVVFSGMSKPTAVRFAPDGRIFVAEKRGIVKVFDSLADTIPDTLIDIRAAVHSYFDRGLLGLAVDFDFPTQPYLYVLYTYNYDPLDPGAGYPRWPDSCPNPPGGTDDGCVANGRLSRFEVAPDNSLVGSEVVLLENRWCQQYPSHSIGDLVFDDHQRVLYVSAGDAASYNWVDYGQGGGDPGSPTPENPCDDPPSGRGGDQSRPAAEGGALRSQDIRSAGDEVTFDGAVLRVDPDSGTAPPDNPLVGGDPADDRIIAYGLRNPFRMTVRPGTHELWIGDVGWEDWEEIDRVADTEDAVVENFGWPCYEGSQRQDGYDVEQLTVCEELYGDSGAPATDPYYAYRHGQYIDPDPAPFRCSKRGSASVSGVAFYEAGPYPAQYDGALFFADYSRQCLWVMFADGSGLPDSGTRTAFMDGASDPVDLQLGPDGMLYYAALTAGEIRRIEYFSDNQPPLANATANPSNGPLALQVQFDGSQSSDPDPGATLSYSWDLDADGQYDDSTEVAPLWTYTAQGEYLVGLEVTDENTASDTDSVMVTAGNTAPTATILEPSSTLLWRVGQEIHFRGEATDPEDGPLPPSAMRWKIILHHCPNGTSECHAHDLEGFDGVDQGSFTAPDHAWYSYLEIQFSASDSGFPGGAGGVLSDQDQLSLDPETVDLTFDSDPPGLELVVGPTREPAPFVRTLIVGSTNSVSAPSPQDLAGSQYTFASWSDGGAQSHEILAADANETYVATFDYAGPASDWWNRDWRRRHRLYIDNTQGGTLLDFPLLVVLDGTRVDYGTTQDQGHDLRFVDDDAATVLAHEVERWDETGTSWVWVKVPQVDASSDRDFIWLYHDNQAAAELQDPAGVWSAGYAGVWHLGEALLDSTSHGNHGTNHGSTGTPGPVGDARDFDGNDWINVGSDASLGLIGDLTLQAWVRIVDPAQISYMRVLSKKDAWNGPAGYNLAYNPGQDLLINLSSGPDSGRADGVDLDVAWHHVAAVISGGGSTLYVDGTDVTTDGTCNALAAGVQALNIGRRSGDGNYFNGAIDEVRVAGVARPGDWIAAQQLSMTDNLLTNDGEQNNCGPSDQSCDGWDDDCDGTVDEDAVAPVGADGLMVERSDLSWNAVAEASAYDVLRGDVDTLRTTDGDFSQSAEECLADDHPNTFLDYAVDPAAGRAFWFLVRGVNCAAAGTYDSGGAGQSSTRDAEIDASPGACP